MKTLYTIFWKVAAFIILCAVVLSPTILLAWGWQLMNPTDFWPWVVFIAIFALVVFPFQIWFLLLGMAGLVELID